MFCSTCGREPAPEEKFCAACGSRSDTNIGISQQRPLKTYLVIGVLIVLIIGLIWAIVQQNKPPVVSEHREPISYDEARELREKDLAQQQAKRAQAKRGKSGKMPMTSTRGTQRSGTQPTTPGSE